MSACAPPQPLKSDGDAACEVTPEYGRQVLEANCVTCHSESNEGIERQAATPGINFDTDDDALEHADRIGLRGVRERTMPPGDSLTDCEADALAAYLDQLTCVPECTGRECGGDGCGGVCGQCNVGNVCNHGVCELDPCAADAGDVGVCDEPCGGACGEQEQCNEDTGECECVPDCEGRECGPDGCGGTCADAQDAGGGDAGDAGTTGDAGDAGATGDVGDTSDVGDAGSASDAGDTSDVGDAGDTGDAGASVCGAGLACNPTIGKCEEPCDPDAGGATCGDGEICNDTGFCECAPNGCGGNCGGCSSAQSCNNFFRCEYSDVSFAGEVMPIVNDAGCGDDLCHGGSDPDEGLVLTSAQAAHDGLVGVASNQQCTNATRVVAGDPTASYLIDKLEGNSNVCFGDRMPSGRGMLAPEDIDIVRAWIANGAEND